MVCGVVWCGVVCSLALTLTLTLTLTPTLTLTLTLNPNPNPVYRGDEGARPTVEGCERGGQGTVERRGACGRVRLCVPVLALVCVCV